MSKQIRFTEYHSDRVEFFLDADTQITLPLEEYAKQTDKMVWVSDMTGLSIDSKWVDQIDGALWSRFELMQ